ncbi:MAG TPA: DUF4440 domain-containing protein [Flavobacteriaceae bacterium]|jgi:ketosteroid isomerase-like protein|nr:DUF4440 domain-containing protein [Flavobacteriaceae bacterium]HBS11983.1 DUF4440 domain-containing protein [Flavobacteriaceae bacterium]
MTRLQIKSTLLLLLFSIHFYAQEYSGSGEDINKIIENTRNFSKAYKDAEYDKLTSFYSKDGKIFPAGADIIVGHEAIKKRWTLPKGTKIVSHKVTPKEIKVIEDYAYDYGYYEGSSSRKKEVSTFKGKYVIVWKKVNDDWKIYLDIWNNIDN